MSKLHIIKEDNIANYIYFIRGEKVMLDADIVSCTASGRQSTKTTFIDGPLVKIDPQDDKV